MAVSPVLVPNSPIMFVGEAPGKDEVRQGTPFVGAAGQELDQWLAASCINRAECSITNVFHEQPPNNKLEAWFVPLKEGGVGPAIQRGKFFPPSRYAEVARLHREIAAVKPNVIVALGNTAAWALLQKTGISALRGATAQSPLGKVLPTYHPAAILRQYNLRAVAIADLIKAKRESLSPTMTLPQAKIIIAPTLKDINDAFNRLSSAPRIAYDIETAQSQITCIGFAEKGFAICIPFVDESKPNNNYWSTPIEEEVAWVYVKRLLALAALKVTQNGLYDIQWLGQLGLRPSSTADDTMLLHHSLQPEMPKSLGFLASVYTDFPSWKKMRVQTTKKDE